MSALRKLAGQTAIYGLSNLLGLCLALFSCQRGAGPSLVGHWLPVDPAALTRGAFEEYHDDSTFIWRINSETAISGTYSVRGDSVFLLIRDQGSLFIEMDFLPKEIPVERSGAVLFEGRLTWLGSDTVIMESGPDHQKARSIITRARQ